MVVSSLSDVLLMLFLNVWFILNLLRLISYSGFWGEIYYCRVRDILSMISYYVDCCNYFGFVVIK